MKYDVFVRLEFVNSPNRFFAEGMMTKTPIDLPKDKVQETIDELQALHGNSQLERLTLYVNDPCSSEITIPKELLKYSVMTTRILNVKDPV